MTRHTPAIPAHTPSSADVSALQACHVLLGDLHRSGVTDLLSNTACDWFTTQFISPFAPSAAPAGNPPDSPRPAPSVARSQHTAPTAPQTLHQSAPSAGTPLPAPQVWVVSPENPSQIAANTVPPARFIVLTTGGVPGQHPFSAQEQRLFAKMMQAIGQDAAQVLFVAMQEAENSAHYAAYKQLLWQQLHPLAPACVLVMGQGAANALLAEQGGFAEARSQTHQLNGKQVVCTYHPRMLLNQPVLKRLAWHDLLLLQKNL